VDKHWLKNDVYEALSADSDPNLTRYNGKDFIKDNSLKMEIKQPLPKIIANYMFNITMGYCDKSFDEKKFNF
jgi:hypothetical protein